MKTGRERKRKKKSGLRRKLKVSTFNIEIKRSGFKIFNSKVFSSGYLCTSLMEYTCWNLTSITISVIVHHRFLTISWRIPNKMCTLRKLHLKIWMLLLQIMKFRCFGKLSVLTHAVEYFRGSWGGWLHFLSQYSS